MTRTVTIYQLSHQLDGGMTWEHYGSKGAADAEARRLSREAIASGEHERGDPGLPVIFEIKVELSREGIAEALNDFVSLTCLNEH